MASVPHPEQQVYHMQTAPRSGEGQADYMTSETNPTQIRPWRAPAVSEVEQVSQEERQLIWPYPTHEVTTTPLTSLKEALALDPLTARVDGKTSKARPSTSKAAGETLDTAVLRGSRQLSVTRRHSHAATKTRQSSATTAVEDAIELAPYQTAESSATARRNKTGTDSPRKADDENVVAETLVGESSASSWRVTGKAVLAIFAWFWRLMRSPNSALFAAFCQQWLCCGLIMGYGVILAYLQDSITPPPKLPELALIGAVPPFLMLFSSVFLARLVDACRTYQLLVNLVGCICILGGVITITLDVHLKDEKAGAKTGLVAGAVILLGVGQACLFILSTHITTTWFTRTRGLAIGLTTCGAAFGQLLSLSLDDHY